VPSSGDSKSTIISSIGVMVVEVSRVEVGWLGRGLEFARARAHIVHEPITHVTGNLVHGHGNVAPAFRTNTPTPHAHSPTKHKPSNTNVKL
jgi:hypothetical protein